MWRKLGEGVYHRKVMDVTSWLPEGEWEGKFVYCIYSHRRARWKSDCARYTIESKGKSIENRPIDCQDMQIFNALCSPTELADVWSKD